MASCPGLRPLGRSATPDAPEAPRRRRGSPLRIETSAVPGDRLTADPSRSEGGLSPGADARILFVYATRRSENAGEARGSGERMAEGTPPPGRAAEILNQATADLEAARA